MIINVPPQARSAPQILNVKNKLMSSRRYIFTFLLSVLSALTLSAQNHNFEVAKNLDIFNTLYRDLDLYYVDTLNAQRNISNAANYMLRMLDPYTEYYPEQDTPSLRQLTTGKYAGIGTSTQYRPDLKRCIISGPFAAGPAALAGLLAGDIIMGIDGRSIDPCSATEAEQQQAYATRISEKLRGEPGTTLTLRVKRPTSGKELTFRLTRRNISLPSVTLATLVSDSTGYISLSQFIEGTSNEVRRALVELKQQGARRLIIDLRNNPGGVLEEAVKTVNLFIPRGREVVSTRGKVKELNHTYRTTLDAQDTDLPIVVLTNEESASAAEIVSGALQDYDRAVIMGQRTYGKGLVQQSRELPYKTQFKLTTGKYYIPSGRCVQAYKFEDGRPVHLPDSLAHEFRTAAGRIVRDGGGITPDVVTPTDSLPTLLTYLEASTQLFDYCVHYRSEHESVPVPRTFHLTDEEYADFCAFMKQRDFTYDRLSLRYLNDLREVAHVEGYDTEAAAEFKALEQKLKHNIDYDFKRWSTEIRRVVEGAILVHYYYEGGRIEHELLTAPDVKAALQLLRSPHQMHKILSGEPDA